MLRITPDLVQHTQHSHRSWWERLQLSTPPAKKQAPLTTRSSSLRCVSVAEHHTAQQYSKTGKTKPQNYLPMSNLSWNTRQDFLKIRSLWEAALETERRCFSKVNLESNVTPNISRSTDCFSTVPSMVNGGGWGCILRNLETIIFLVLLAFNFIPQRSHHAFTLTRSRFRDSEWWASAELIQSQCSGYAELMQSNYRANAEKMQVWCRADAEAMQSQCRENAELTQRKCRSITEQIQSQCRASA